MFKKRAFKRQTLFPSGPLPMKHVLLISFGFFIVSTILAIWIVNKAIEPTLMKYAESETKKMASVVINKAIEESIAENKDLNEVISDAQLTTPAPVHNGKRFKIYYATQVAVQPPCFVLSCNDPKLLHFSYERFIENEMRRAFDFEGTPIKIIARKKVSE